MVSSDPYIKKIILFEDNRLKVFWFALEPFQTSVSEGMLSSNRLIHSGSHNFDAPSADFCD
jgi:hypothetical protein